MTLADLLQQPRPIDIDVARSLWLVFDAEYLAQLNAAQADQTVHRAVPLELTDGRFALCADLLTEIDAGGIFALQFSRLDAANFPEVDVLSTDAITQLMPAPAEILP
jgi:hypothetical protein